MFSTPKDDRHTDDDTPEKADRSRSKCSTPGSLPTRSGRSAAPGTPLASGSVVGPVLRGYLEGVADGVAEGEGGKAVGAEGQSTTYGVATAAAATTATSEPPTRRRSRMRRCLRTAAAARPYAGRAWLARSRTASRSTLSMSLLI